jgi:Mg-chelatase subunit ChlD
MTDFEYSPGMEPEAEVIPRDEASMLSVDVKPGRTHVLGGVKNIIRVLASIRAPEIDTPDISDLPTRAPLQVACVLDCSGSMGGQPLEFAKRGVLKLVKHLLPTDTLHFITYATRSQVVFRNGDLSEVGKETLKSTVASIRADGQTNLFGGLQAAVDLFNETLAEEGGHCTESQVRRIFLFSDGQVNCGVTDKGEIQRRVAEWAAQGITTSSFGIGSYFDEPLMRGIAEAGKGKYTYLATAQDIPKLVSKSVHGLVDLFGSEATIDVRGMHHTTVSRIYGADDDLDNEGYKDSAIATPGLLALGDLHRGSARRVLVELEVAAPGGMPDGTSFEAAEWIISFQRQGAQAQFSGKVDLKVTSSRSFLEEECTAVRAAFTIQKAADLDLEISQHLAHNDRIRAAEAKSRQISLLKETLGVVRSDSDAQAEVQALERVLVRAERVSAQIERGEDNERVRRQCVQEMECNRCMSDDGWASGCDSEAAGDVANLRDVRSPSNSPPSSPRGSRSRTRSNSGTPPGSPRFRGWQSSIPPGVFNLPSPPTLPSPTIDVDSDIDALSDTPCNQLLFFCPPHADALCQQLLPRLQDCFEVTHVADTAAAVSAIENNQFHACVAKLGVDADASGEDVIRTLRVKQGTNPFVAVHSATASRNPQMQYKLEEEYGVNFFATYGQEDELVNALKLFSQIGGDGVPGGYRRDNSSCVLS